MDGVGSKPVGVTVENHDRVPFTPMTTLIITQHDVIGSEVAAEALVHSAVSAKADRPSRESPAVCPAGKNCRGGSSPCGAEG